MDGILYDWPEPVIRVQSISESGATVIPDRYIKPLSDRPSATYTTTTSAAGIPIIDLSNPDSIIHISSACREWGFFQVINHGINSSLMKKSLETWRDFFHLPMHEKQKYANSPKTYEGYGSRLGVEKGAILDWGDYYYLHLQPLRLKNPSKWPELPEPMRPTIEEYGKEVTNLCDKLLEKMSQGLGLPAAKLAGEFGDEGVCMRTNYYPRCPQPELALGLSAHSDPGGLTVLLVDDRVRGLEVRRGGEWIAVDPAVDAFVVNVGDQIQVLSNAIYKSVEHRVTVNSVAERLSIAFFYNPRSDIPISPIVELLSPDRPALYHPMTFDEYRMAIRKLGPCGKKLEESLESPR